MATKKNKRRMKNLYLHSINVLVTVLYRGSLREMVSTPSITQTVHPLSKNFKYNSKKLYINVFKVFKCPL